MMRHTIIPNSSAITEKIKSVCASGKLFFKEPSPIPFQKYPASLNNFNAWLA